MDSLQDLKRKNDEAAAKELAELRADTIKGLRFAFRCGGVAGVLRLLTEALGEATSDHGIA